MLQKKSLIEWIRFQQAFYLSGFLTCWLIFRVAFYRVAKYWVFFSWCLLSGGHFPGGFFFVGRLTFACFFFRVASCLDGIFSVAFIGWLISQTRSELTYYAMFHETPYVVLRIQRTLHTVQYSSNFHCIMNAQLKGQSGRNPTFPNDLNHFCFPSVPFSLCKCILSIHFLLKVSQKDIM